MRCNPINSCCLRPSRIINANHFANDGQLVRMSSCQVHTGVHNPTLLRNLDNLGAPPSTRRSFCQSQCLPTFPTYNFTLRDVFYTITRPRFDAGPVSVSFVGDYTAPGEVFFFLSISFLQCYYHSTNIPYLHINP